MDESTFAVLARHSGATETRRSLLRVSLGGFALVASGLVLPEWLEEADAREGALGGKLGGRHGQNHRGRNRNRNRHRRDRDRREDRHPPKGILDNEGLLNIQFIFVNNNDVGTEPIGVICSSYKWNTAEVMSWEEKTVRPGAGVAFKTTVKKASLLIDHDRHLVWAKNPLIGSPSVEIDSAGGRGGAGPKDMGVGDRLSWQYGNYKIDVSRLRDADDYKIFSVTYES